MNQIGKNIVDAFKMLAIIVGVVGGLFLGLFIIALILGIIFGLVNNGTIPVDANTNQTMINLQGNFSNIVGQITGGASTAGSLIVVAVVLIVFGGLVYWGYTKYKKGKGNSGQGGY